VSLSSNVEVFVFFNLYAFILLTSTIVFDADYFIGYLNDTKTWKEEDGWLGKVLRIFFGKRTSPTPKKWKTQTEC